MKRRMLLLIAWPYRSIQGPYSLDPERAMAAVTLMLTEYASLDFPAPGESSQ